MELGLFGRRASPRLRAAGLSGAPAEASERSERTAVSERRPVAMMERAAWKNAAV